MTIPYPGASGTAHADANSASEAARAAASERETLRFKIRGFYRGRVSGERRKIGGLLKGREVADNLGVGGAVAAKRDDGGGLRIGNAAAHEFEQGQFAHARVFQVGERSAGENGPARRALARHFEENGVRKAGEPHGLKLSRSHPQLVHPGKFEDRVFADLRANQAGDFIAPIERLAAAAINLDCCNAACVGKSGLPRGDELSDFRRCDIKGRQLVNGVVIHPGSIERLGIERRDGMATGHKQHDGEH